MKSFRKNVKIFWERFFQAEKQLRQWLDQDDQKKAQEYMRSLLENCLPNSTFSIAKRKHERYMFALSPKGDRLLYLYYHYLVNKAPKTLGKVWDFYDTFIKKENLEVTLINGHVIAYDDIWIYPSIEREHIALAVYGDIFLSMNQVDQQNTMKTLLDQSIGEFYRMYVISEMKFVKRPKQGGIPLSVFSTYVDRIIEQYHWTYVKHPHQIYYTYAILPKQEEMLLRYDVYSGVSSQLAIINEMVHQEDHYVRYAQDCGIMIGFLFYEHSHIDPDQRLIQRENLDEMINQICKKKGIAENIGAANGIFYTYLDYVVYDWDLFLTSIMPLLEDIDTHLYGFQPLVLKDHPLYLVDNRPKGLS